MLLSFGVIFITGMILGYLFHKMKLPSLLGMIITGILLGPHMLNVLDASLLNISAELRQIALVIILTRAGLNLDIEDLRKVGRPAILLCFVPACMEIIGTILLAPALFGVSYLEAAIMGTTLAAVSPAVIVPRMLKLMENGYGRQQRIPQMIMAGASVDDVFVIVLFTAFLSMAKGEGLSAWSLLTIPSSIVLGLAAGMVLGILLAWIFTKFHMRDSVKVIIILSFSFLLVSLEHAISGPVGFSGLLAVMALGVMLQMKKREVSKRLSGKFSKLWVGAEILLFVLVGATVDLRYAVQAGLVSVVLILLLLLFRMIGVLLCLVGTSLHTKERWFAVFAYMPKATVQAAIGGIPLAAGLACGEVVLTVAVVSILVTAPLGAMLIDRTYQKLLRVGS